MEALYEYLGHTEECIGWRLQTQGVYRIVHVAEMYDADKRGISMRNCTDHNTKACGVDGGNTCTKTLEMKISLHLRSSLNPFLDFIQRIPSLVTLPQ